MAYLYFPELVDWNLGSNSSGPTSERSVGSKITIMLQPVWYQECGKAPWTRLLFGTTSQPLVDQTTEERWISSLQDSLVNHGVVPDSDEELRTNGGSGMTSPRLFAKWDQTLLCWRTSQESSKEDFQLYSETWPKWGMMQGGGVLGQTKLAHPIDGGGYSSWPTPQAFDATECQRSPEALARAKQKGGCRNLREEVMNWPTPSATEDNQDRGTQAYKEAIAQRPNTQRKLAVSAALWEPQASLQVKETPKPGDESSQPIRRLNPLFVEALMGLPRNWTHLYVVSDFAAWAMRWSRNKQPTQ